MMTQTMPTPTPTPGRPVLVLCGGTDSVKHVRHTFATLTRPSSASTRLSWLCEPKSPPSTLWGAKNRVRRAQRADLQAEPNFGTPQAAAAFSEQPSSTAHTSAKRPASPSLALRRSSIRVPPRDVSRGRPTASKEARMNPQPFTTYVGASADME